MLRMSVSQLTTFYECPRKWYYNYHMRRCRPSSSAMSRGSCYHKIFELFHGEGMSLEEISATILADHRELVEFLPECMAAFIGYRKQQPELTFVNVNGKPAVEQEFILQLADDIVLRGKIDYIHSIGTKAYITDIKCTGMYLSDYYFGQFELGFQSMLYSYVGSNFFDNIEGFMIDAVMMRKGATVKYDRCFYPLLPNLDEFIDEIYRTAYWIKDNLPLGEGAFEHRWTSCSGKFGKCAYYEVCKSSPKIREKLLALDDFVDYRSISIGGYSA